MSRSPLWFAVCALTLLAVPAAAATPGIGDSLLERSLLSLAVLAGAMAAHWALRRLGKRAPLWLARRSGKPITPGVSVPWELAFQLILLVPKVCLWLGVAAYVSERFEMLRQARLMLVHVVGMSLTSPMFALNGREYSSLDLVELPAVLAAVWVAISGLTRVLKMHVLRATRLEVGVQEAVALLTRYALVFLGAIVVLQIWGIDASSLTFVASVLGVGIGFGLQHIANNFVSGLVVSLERPIQPGDFVKVGEWEGTVERVGPRNTEIRTQDSVSILVPNSRFLESEVVNWSHGDPTSRLHVPVAVAYGSDISRVRAALLEAAHDHPEILSDPRPRVEFRSFGDSALQFELLVWTHEPRLQHRLISDLNYRIATNLQRYKIQIPFPQRDLHLRSPQIEQLLSALSRRHFSEAELAAPHGQDATTEILEASPNPPDWLEDELGPRSWSDEQITTVVARMRSPGGLAVGDRRHLLTVYRDCFVGREAVDWMTRALGLTRKEAVELGQLLMDRGLVRHVLDEHGFRDGSFFYSFRPHQAEPADERAALSA